MKPVEIKTMGLSLNTNEPQTAEEYDQLAGALGACVASAAANIRYRNQLTRFRSAFCEWLEEETGIERESEVSNQKTIDKAIEEGKEPPEEKQRYTESEFDYFKGVCSQLSVEPTIYQAKAQEIMDSIPFDPKAPEPKAATPKKVPKKLLEVANELNAAGSGPAVYDKLVELNPGVAKDGAEYSVEGLARLIHANELRKARMVKDAYVDVASIM